jgi:hypothetical protein
MTKRKLCTYDSSYGRVRKRRKIQYYDDSNKINHNRLFVRESKKMLSEFPGSIVFYLDSELLNTTKRLLRAGIPIENMRIAEMDKNTVKQQRHKEPNLEIYPCTLYMALCFLHLFYKKTKISSLWFDYMGIWKGNKNKKIFPKKDLELAVKYLLTDKCCISITFSTRGVLKKSCNGVDGRIFHPLQEIKEIFKKYGYKVEKCSDELYKRNSMVYLQFILYK